MTNVIAQLDKPTLVLLPNSEIWVQKNREKLYFYIEDYGRL